MTEISKLLSGVLERGQPLDIIEQRLVAEIKFCDPYYRKRRQDRLHSNLGKVKEDLNDKRGKVYGE